MLTTTIHVNGLRRHQESESGSRWRGAGITIGVMAVVAVLAQAPVLATTLFYYWDDSAAVLLPDWRMIGDQLWAWHWPTLMTDWWAGGNIAGEAMFGLWNPVSLANDMLVSLVPDLMVAATLVK